MFKKNYSAIMEEEIKRISESGEKPSLLLHSCCAPCSTVPIEILCEHFKLTVLYYNPNIYPESEFEKRTIEQEKFCSEFKPEYVIDFISVPYNSDDFKKIAKGLEKEKETGSRCTLCYNLRLEKTAQYAAEHGFDYFTTTLSLSPLKDAVRLNEIGGRLSEKYGVKYLYSDFKKKEGYKRSCVLSDQFGIYRQDYCGCVFSLVSRYLQSTSGIIFDVDGTMCDTMGFYENFLGDHLKSLGIIPSPDIREKVRGSTIAEAYEYVIKEYNIPMTLDEMLKDIDRLFEDFYANRTFLKDGVREFMSYAKERGIKMCIATATDKKYIEMMTRHMKIDSDIEFIITSQEAGRGKHFPDIYDKACEKLGLEKKDVLVFEDAYHAVKTAKNAGYRIVGVEDEYQMKFKDIVKEYSDIYVKKMTDLINPENLEF